MNSSLDDILINVEGGCKNPSCGHSTEDHPFTTSPAEDHTTVSESTPDLTIAGFARSCTKCDCKSFEYLTRLMGFSTTLVQDNTQSLVSENVQLEKQIDSLEDALGNKQKEVDRLKKKLKNKTLKVEELAYLNGLLKLDLQISENVKRNLKHIIDNEE